MYIIQINCSTLIYMCGYFLLVTHQSSSNEKKATGSSSLPAKPVFLNQHRKTAESEWKLQLLLTVKLVPLHKDLPKCLFHLQLIEILQDTRYCGNIFQNLLVFIDE